MYNLDNTTRLAGYPAKLEQKETSKGTVTTFRLPTNRKTPSGDKTEWHNCVAWGKTGDLIARIWRPKGRIEIEGRIEYGHFFKKVEVGGETVEVRIPTTEIVVNAFNIQNRRSETAE